MKTRLLLFAFLITILGSYAIAQHISPEITAGELRTHVQYLASDELQGRGSGTPGNVAAAKYVSELFAQYGLQPAGDNGTYFQSFEFISSLKLGKSNRFSITHNKKKTSLKVDTDFRPFGFSSTGLVSAPIVFAGYGISAPDKGYDDFKNIDVTGKIVVVLRFGPDGNDPHSELNQFTAFRTKARMAREKGAAGMIVITGPRDDDRDDILKLTFDNAFANSGIPAVSMKRTPLLPLFASMNHDLGKIQDSIKAGRNPISFEFKNADATMATEVVKVHSKTANVVGMLKGNDPTVSDKAIVIGAHLDHLGMGGPGSGSLQPDTVAIHNGADDNASGTAGLIELAQSFASRKSTLRHSMIFIAFSAEELGTLGAAHFVNNPFIPLDKINVMINMDMIGKLENNHLTVYGTGTSPGWNALLDKLNADSALTLKRIPDGFGPSDHAQFYGKDIPVLFFFTGTHNDYHKPSDDWEKLNYEGTERIVKFAEKVIWEVDAAAEKPAFTKVQSASPSSGGDTRGFTVTLGVVPDYGETEIGMKIGGTRPNGPADKAGLVSGDVIVKLAGKNVLNIYDYMAILGELKPEMEVEVEVIREGVNKTFVAKMQRR